MQILNDLPRDHPDRNRPLLGGWYRWREAKLWKEIKPTFLISRVTFNDLGTTWTDFDVFTFEEPI
jgi:hypothetical protein